MLSKTLKARSFVARSLHLQTAVRSFAAPTEELMTFLQHKGITSKNIVHNPTVPELYEYAVSPEHVKTADSSVYATSITEQGALSVSSGKKMGRVPKEKRVLLDETTKDTVWWGSVNMPIPQEGWERNRQRTVDYLSLKQLFVMDGFIGWDPHYQLKARIICTRPYHAIFMKQMMIRAPNSVLNKEFAKGVDFTVMNAGEYPADPHTENATSNAAVTVNFKAREYCILGTQYAGEMKKGLFGVMHYLMPQRQALSMHASANEGKYGDTTILFGLSGTGKTTLSADPNRALIGDDEHVWTEKGIFNLEGGCYAKTVGLTEEKEPEIYRAIKFGALLENVPYHPGTRSPNFDDISLTENTRVTYPLEHIPGAKIPAVGGHPKNIIFLTCDANGVLPPVSRLTSEQAMYHFISGYTAKVAGTEVGIKDPVATFSACFGEAFLPLHPYKYAKMLAEKTARHQAHVWLINTGWSGGKYGVGKRMSLKTTRTILDAIHSGELDNAPTDIMPGFNLHVPKKVTGVDSKILMPINTWEDKAAYKEQTKKLAGQFQNNFRKYAEGTPAEVVQKGGPTLDF